jgi:hypothetical protein
LSKASAAGCPLRELSPSPDTQQSLAADGAIASFSGSLFRSTLNADRAPELKASVRRQKKMIETILLMQKRRRYAPFSEWPMHKSQMELHIATHLMLSLKELGKSLFVNPRLHDPDPPDIVADLLSGGSCAIEITELVDEHLASTREHVAGDPRVWRPDELKQDIERALSRKDSKVFHGGPYGATIVCLFTGEPLLSFDNVRDEIACVSYGPYHQLTAAYLMFSYDVELKVCRIVELNLVA